MNQPYEPQGTRFYDAASRREMLLINEPGHPNDGWLCWRHPDDQWVTERKAGDLDRMQIASARDRAAQKRDPLREPITENETLRARLAASEERARRAEQELEKERADHVNDVRCAERRLLKVEAALREVTPDACGGYGDFPPEGGWDAWEDRHADVLRAVALGAPPPAAMTTTTPTNEADDE